MLFLKRRQESVQKGTKKCNCTVETLMGAVEAVRTNRLSLHRASDVYGIGKSTINDHVNKRVNKV